MERFGQPERIEAKGRGNLVTETDLAVEAAVLELLSREFPGHRAMSEETAAEIDHGDKGWLWVVDPVDGTHNYSRGNPNFAFNIALCLDGEPVLGLTHSPVTGHEFFAERGGGLWVNGARARVSNVDSLRQSVLGAELGYNDVRGANALALISDIWPAVQSVRITGSAALGLAFAACGRYDVFIHHFLFPWDVAAGIILIKEAGGLIVDRDGGPVTIHSEGVIAGAPGPVRELLALAESTPWR